MLLAIAAILVSLFVSARYSLLSKMNPSSPMEDVTGGSSPMGETVSMRESDDGKMDITPVTTTGELVISDSQLFLGSQLHKQSANPVRPQIWPHPENLRNNDTKKLISGPDLEPKHPIWRNEKNEVSRKSQILSESESGPHPEIWLLPSDRICGLLSGPKAHSHGKNKKDDQVCPQVCTSTVVFVRCIQTRNKTVYTALFNSYLKFSSVHYRNRRREMIQ